MLMQQLHCSTQECCATLQVDWERRFSALEAEIESLEILVNDACQVRNVAYVTMLLGRSLVSRLTAINLIADPCLDPCLSVLAWQLGGGKSCTPRLSGPLPALPAALFLFFCAVQLHAEVGLLMHAIFIYSSLP
jgi:hypothetical protein